MDPHRRLLGHGGDRAQRRADQQPGQEHHAEEHHGEREPEPSRRGGA